MERAQRAALRLTQIGSAAALATGILSIRGFLSGAATQLDEGVLLLYPALLRAGRQPYRDFRFLYGPAQAWMLSVLPNAIITERLVGLACRGAVAVGMYVIVKERAPALALTAASLSFVLGLGAGIGGYAWWPALALLTFALVCADRDKLVLAGLLAGAAVLFRFDLALAALAVGISKNPRNLGRFVLGASASAALLGAQVMASGWSHFWQSTVLDEIHQAAGRRLPIPGGFLLWGLILIVLASVWLVATARNATRARHAAVAVLMLGSVFQRMDSVHIAYVAAFTLPLVLTAVASVDRRVVLALVALAFLAAPVRWIGANAATSVGLRHADGASFTFRGKTWITAPGDERGLLGLLATVEAQPGCTLFVGPTDLRYAEFNDSFLYWLVLDRFDPVTPFLELNPGIANRAGSGWNEQLRFADVVVLDAGLNRPHHGGPPGPDIRSSLANHTRVAAPRPFEIYRRNGAPRDCTTTTN